MTIAMTTTQPSRQQAAPRPRARLVCRWLLALLLAPAGLAAPLAQAGNPIADPYLQARRQMVDQIRQQGITQPAVLRAMELVPRHLFVPEEYRQRAYADEPVPIGSGKSIYQPYMVALMTELLDLDGKEKVLEIGTGSGYHTAVLSRVAREVYTVEIDEPLGKKALKTLATVGYHNIWVHIGDGYNGWPSEAPFDAIILTAAPPYVPQPLIDQLKIGGKMVIPVGNFLQDLQVLTKTEHGVETRKVGPVRVPAMTGEAQDR